MAIRFADEKSGADSAADSQTLKRQTGNSGKGIRFAATDSAVDSAGGRPNTPPRQRGIRFADARRDEFSPAQAARVREVVDAMQARIDALKDDRETEALAAARTATMAEPFARPA